MFRITTNMRSSIYLYIKSNYFCDDVDAIKNFALDNDLSLKMLKSFIDGKGNTYLSQVDFEKICTLLNPPSYIKKRWQKMYLIKSRTF
jgi:hypothetical protein